MCVYVYLCSCNTVDMCTCVLCHVCVRNALMHICIYVKCVYVNMCFRDVYVKDVGLHVCMSNNVCT